MVQKTIDVLNYLSNHPKGGKLTAIAEELKYPKTTVHDILKTLLNNDFVQYSNLEKKIYCIGTQAYTIGITYLESSRLFLTAKHYLILLADKYEKTTFLAKRHNDRVICVYKYASPHAKAPTGNIGDQKRLHSTAIGKCYMAFDPDAAPLIDTIELVRFTPYTITDREQLKEHLKQIQAQGYSWEQLSRLLPAAALLPVLLAACSIWAAPSFPVEEEGRLWISVAGEGARTLFPDSAALTYALDFDSTDSRHREGLLGSGASGLFVLPPGVWNITLNAMAGDAAVARGSAENVVITKGKSTTLRITPQPLVGGPGYLEWSVDYPAGVDAADLYISEAAGAAAAGFSLNLAGMTPVGTVRSGIITLSPGSRLLRVHLKNSATNISAGRADAIHIYSGQTTRAAYVFTAADFTGDTGDGGSSLYPPVILSANNSSNTYSLITSKGYGYETPDQNADGGHSGVAHITQIYDAELGKYVFAFAMHYALDKNATGDQTRQRVEIKVDNDTYRGKEGRSFIYRWKFKLPADFAPSSDFTHIHQIKNEGGDSSAPVITLTPRLSGSNKNMQLIYRAPTYNYNLSGEASSSNRILKQVSLNDFLGEWVQAVETITYSSNTATAAYSITIKRIQDNKDLLSYTHSPSTYASLESNTTKWPFITWRPTNTYGRPKNGLYRLIVSGLKDETILYADFELERLK
ncbi:hypothetical protein FACS1894124_6480 [Spirochaetia bacterium]|nr:hypothetical protein FACS1894124_6480 [Spirochaetia bacterium]